MTSHRRSASALAAALVLSSSLAAQGSFTIQPSQQDVCVGEPVELSLCTRPGDFTLLLVAKASGQTILPGIGTFDVPFDPFPTVLQMGVAGSDGCFQVSETVPCDCSAVTFHLQGVSVDLTDMSILISNPSAVDVSTLCNDLDQNGVNDSCDPDCDGDGVLDVMELDSDGDGTPNECDEQCGVAQSACDGGCFQLGNNASFSNGPTSNFGLRLDGMFGDAAKQAYTFSSEYNGSDLQLCHDPQARTIHVYGLLYGGRGIAPAWDPSMQGFALLDFTWTGAKCEDGETIVELTDGAGFGSITWLASGQSIELSTPPDYDGVLATLDEGFGFEAVLHFPGMPLNSVQEMRHSGVALTACP